MVNFSYAGFKYAMQNRGGELMFLRTDSGNDWRSVNEVLLESHECRSDFISEIWQAKRRLLDMLEMPRGNETLSDLKAIGIHRGNAESLNQADFSRLIRAERRV